MAGFSEAAGRFFYFLLVLLSVALCEGAYFRLIAYLAPTLEQGNVLTGPLVSLQVVFAGYLITYEHLPRWLVWLFWLSPLSYALRAISRNELNDPAYAAPSPLGGDLATYFLSTYQFQPEQLWLWGSVVVLLGAALALTAGGALALTYVRYDRSIGSSRAPGAGFAGDGGACDAVEASSGEGAEGACSPATVAVDIAEAHLAPTTSPSAEAVVCGAQIKPGATVGALPVTAPGGVALGSSVSSTSAPSRAATPGTGSGAVAGIRAASALPFAPASLAFSGICYDVPLPRKAGGGTRRLLRGVSGYARPGTLTLLMGSSGAGKTTLLDAIAGRKNSGTLAGSVHLGGQRVSKQTMGRSTAFVEQLDSHHSLTTVREALLFSAELRLPPTVTRAQREAFVAEILDILDLTPLQNRLVGQPNADGLSASQMKRLSIGVELAGNCPLVFLDEPTTGLSSAGAESVMRAMRRLADSGRTVISTIHQPSAAIYRMADMLLLLQKGGYQVYFGPVGEGGGAVVSFLAEAAVGVDVSGAAQAAPAGTGPHAAQQRAAGSGGGGTRIPYFQAAPHGMNPASYMLEALGREVDHMAAAGQTGTAGSTGYGDAAALPGTRQEPSAQHAIDAAEASGVMMVRTAEDALSAPREAVGSVSNAAVHMAAIMPSASVPDGGLFAAYWATCDLQARAAAELQALVASEAQASTRSLAAGERALPDFARSFPAQLWILLRRTWVAYARNVPYNFTRIVVLCALALIFGLVYLRISDGDIAGVQSKISVIFLTLSFGAVLNYSTPLPVLERERPMVYRERSSGMYTSWAYSLATALVEVPYVGFISLCFTAIYYPMVGLAADPSIFFAYVLTLWQLSITFVFLGHLFVFAFPSVAIAQAAAGTIVSAYFLLAGLFAPYPALPRGWIWFYRINPIAYGLEALVTPQFWCEGASCPTISLPVGAATVDVPLYSYLSSYFGLDYGMRWRDVGILFGFMLGFLALSGASLRYITWVKR
jgi:ABC-type multidrug transport system ATPase subunit/ABC-type multidrug transport system permease subunit